jgi:hypothetical protein
MSELLQLVRPFNLTRPRSPSRVSISCGEQNLADTEDYPHNQQDSLQSTEADRRGIGGSLSNWALWHDTVEQEDK